MNIVGALVIYINLTFVYIKHQNYAREGCLFHEQTGDPNTFLNIS